MSQDPPKIPKESSFLPPSDDPTSPREMKRARTSQEQQESPQDSSFLSPKETETSCSSVSPMNRDKEAFKRSRDSAGNMCSKYYLESKIQMISTPGYVKSNKKNSGTCLANSDEDSQQANDKLQSLGMPGEGYANNPVAGSNVSNSSSISDSVGMNAKSVDSSSSSFTRNTQGERYGTNSSDPLGFRSNISLSPEGSIVSMMKKDKEKFIMIPTPKPVKAPTWTITKKLTKTDIKQRLILSKASFGRIHLSTADTQIIDQRREPVSVNVYDHDMKKTHELHLAHDGSCYNLTHGWRKFFVKDRGLNEGDEIGLVWDTSAYMLRFGVISRANAKAPADEKRS